MRSCSERDKWAYKDNRPEEEKGKTKEVEINYVYVLYFSYFLFTRTVTTLLEFPITVSH